MDADREHATARGIQRQRNAQGAAGIAGCLGCGGTLAVLVALITALGLGHAVWPTVVAAVVAFAVSIAAYNRVLNHVLDR